MARCPFEFCGGETTLAYTLSAFDVLQCGRCGIRYRHPFPTSQEMDAMYADADYHSAGYFADQFDEASASLPERAIYADLLSLLHGGAGKRLLDVGSGAGLFLRMASEAGYQAEGVELSSALAERSAAQWGVRVHNADFAHWNGSGEGYDVVTMWDFLEHVPDPLATMRRASGLLRPQGLLAVLTIDSSSLFNVLGAAAYRLSAGKASRPLELLYDRRHTFYFDRRHTRMLAERAGLAVYEQRFYRAHLGRWLSVPIPWWMRLGGDAVDLASLLVRHPYRQLLVARKATPASPRQ